MTFRNFIRELELLHGSKITIPLSADAQGYLDRECPAPGCRFVFKVLLQHWQDRFRDEAVHCHCPRCGHKAPSTEWRTTVQAERSRKQLDAIVRARLDNALHRDTREFNASAPRDLIQISMRAPGTGNARTTAVPVEAAAIVQQILECDQCGARCALIGAAFFCPCCGNNSVEQTFDRALAKVRTKVEEIETIRNALVAHLGPDETDTFCRSTIENGLQDCVVAFQHLAERLYRQLPGTNPPPHNVFQRLDAGSDLWRAALGKGYQDWLESDELKQLALFFQQRHLLAHRDGFVDERYIMKSGDVTYAIGQRIVVSAADVARLVRLVEKLATSLRAALNEISGSALQ